MRVQAAGKGEKEERGGREGYKRECWGYMPLEPLWCSMTFLLFFSLSLSLPSFPLPFLHFSSSPVTVDYGALPSTILTFDSSTTQHTVPVTIIDDNQTEPTETFTGQLTLMSPVSSRISVSPSQTTVSIEDNDSEE